MQGKVIEYVEHGRFICAVVMSESGKRLHLLNLNGREVNLPVARVVHQSKSLLPIDSQRNQIIQDLQEICQIRQEMKLPTPLQEVWELASEDVSQSYTPRFLAELCFGGQAGDDQIAAFLRAVFEDRIYFRYRGEMIQAHSPEVVEQLLVKQEQEQKKEVMLGRGSEAIAMIWAGEEPGEWPAAECVKLLNDYYLFANEAADWQLARELLKRAGLTRPHDPFRFLVKIGHWQANENIALLRHQIPQEFPDEALSQTDSILTHAGKIEDDRRLDLRDLRVLTIDGPSTRDFDDALHIEKRGDNFEVGIHITDVARYLAPGSPLFKEAEYRTTSLYLPDANIPMLPRELSEGLLSLIAGEDRAALSFMLTISSAGEVLSSKIVRSVIRVKEQLTYFEAEELCKTDPDLKNLLLLSRTLYQNRIEAGALIIPIPDVTFRFEQGEVTDVVLLDVNVPMRMMIAEYMVLANCLAAAYLSDRQEAGLYRTQAPARKRFFKQPGDDLFINFRQRRFLSRGHLLTTPKPHDGVGTQQYTTVTSPIRRILDLVIQHQISGLLSGEGARFSEAELNGFASIISSSQSKINLVRQLRHRYWLFKYLETRKDQRFAAFVLDRRNHKVQVVLKDLLFEGELPANQAFWPELGDNVMVRIGQVSALNNTIRLEW